jgi:hypothetical protein
VEDTRSHYRAGASIEESARLAVRGNPETAEWMRSFPGARRYYDAEFEEYVVDEKRARTPRDGAKARQRMRALRAIGVALGW